jgi:arylsulfatase A-like enzyme
MRTLNRRSVIRLLGAGALGAATMSTGEAAREERSSTRAKRPNILFIITDDQAQSALSIYGNSILRTPNMDRIGREGIRFDQAFVTNSLCAPSRASFLTGLYSHTHGVTTNGEESGWYDQHGLSDTTPTWPKLLRAAGYQTAVVGKWHLKSLPSGFDHWAILPGHGRYFEPEFIANGQQTRFKGHVDDVIADRALAWLKGRDVNKPFCLLCQFKAPHSPWEPAPRYASEFADATIPIPIAFESKPESMPKAVSKTQMSVEAMDFRSRGVSSDLPGDERRHANLQTFVKNYYRVLLGVDDNVGRLLAFLDEANLARDTLVIYTSDNGFFLGEFGLFDKRLMYEPSIKVPMLVRWPAGIEGGRIDNNHMVLNVDVAPTLLELGGAQVPGQLHGRSWKPLFDVANAQTRDEKAVSWRDAFLYEFYEYPAVHCVRKHRGVRTDRWKLIHFWERPEEYALYDLASDPNELVNLAARPEQRERLQELKHRLRELRELTGDHESPRYVAPTLQPGKCPK